MGIVVHKTRFLILVDIVEVEGILVLGLVVVGLMVKMKKRKGYGLWAMVCMAF